MTNHPIVAVLTGDIVGSTRLDAQRRLLLFQTFPRLSDLLAARYPKEVRCRISNFRGDGWQVVVSEPRKAFEISLFIRAFIRFTFQPEKLDTRSAIGIGRVQFVPADNVSAGDGAAYLESGRLLDSFTAQRMGLRFDRPASSLEQRSLETILTLLDQIVSAWGAGQSQAVFWALHGYNQVRIAEHWLPSAIKQASVSSSLKSAGWEQVKRSLSTIEALIDSVIKENGE